MFNSTNCRYLYEWETSVKISQINSSLTIILICPTKNDVVFDGAWWLLENRRRSYPSDRCIKFRRQRTCLLHLLFDKRDRRLSTKVTHKHAATFNISTSASFSIFIFALVLCIFWIGTFLSCGIFTTCIKWLTEHDYFPLFLFWTRWNKQIWLA